MPLRRCNRCGAKVPLVARFCPYCGEALEENKPFSPPEFTWKRKDYVASDGKKVAVVEMSGAIEARHARKLRELFNELDSDGVERTIFCMRGVTYISSAALGLLVSYASDRRMKTGTHSVFLTDVSQAVGGAMSVLGIMPFFAIFPSTESALRSLGIEPEEESEVEGEPPSDSTD